MNNSYEAIPSFLELLFKSIFSELCDGVCSVLLLNFGRFGNGDLVTSKGVFLSSSRILESLFQGVGSLCLTCTERDSICCCFFMLCIL